MSRRSTIACLAAGLFTLAAAARPQSPTQADAPAQPETDAAAELQPTAEPRTATVVLRDGQVLTGTLISESDEAVVLEINGVRTTIGAEHIRESYIQPPVEERYRQIRGTVADDDPERLVQLAEWLITRNRPDLALPDLELALKADPFNARARELKVLAVEAARLLAPREGNEPRQATEPIARPDAPAAPVFPLISDEDVNTIRVYEVDLDDPPKLSIERSVMESFIEQYGTDPAMPTTQAGREALLSAPPIEQLRMLFTLKARDHYHGVRVLTEPDALTRFRDDVYRGWLARGCATARCHGGAAAGRLWIPRAASPDARTYLTTFLILDRYRTTDGMPLINYDQPEMSLLLQAGLPKRAATYPHPEVDGWRSVFRGAASSGFRASADWIGAMYTPRPEYPVDYTPPSAMVPEEQPGTPPR
jgi:hypothetical protein